jgi:hypothetical protein
MAMSSRLSPTLLGTALLLSGCVNEPIGVRDAGLGEAVKYNAAVQTISPDPIYPEGSAEPGENGDKMARAVKRYREGEVKEVEMMETTSGQSGGSSGPP